MDFLKWLLCHFFGLCYPPSSPVITQAILKGTEMSTVSLSWTVPTTRTDGTALTAAEIANSTIFDNAVQIATVPGATNSFTTGTLTVGVHNFSITVTDTTGHTSAMSNTASVTVLAVLAPPSAVTDLSAVLNP